MEAEKQDTNTTSTDTPAGAEDVWEEVWEDNNDESGNLIRQRRKEVEKYQWKPELACKKCDKVLESDQHLRKHVKEHSRLQNEILKCHHCDFMTDDSDIHVNHVVDNHSTRHTCLTCGELFPSKSEMVLHAGNMHPFIYNQKKVLHKEVDCHDCEAIFNNKFELMEHKREMHHKQRLCSYYHGNGWGCRFPTSCLDIHNENITPVLTNDNRGKIPCRHGDSCLYRKKNICHYKHTQNNYAPSAPPMESVLEEEVQLLERKICAHCKYETNTETEFKWHVETQHGARPKEAKGITVTSAQKYPIGHPQWAAHKNINSNIHDYKCKECAAEFTIESMLTAHIDRAHNVKYIFNCTQCNNVFSKREEVGEHMKQKHSTTNSMETVVSKLSEQLSVFTQRLESLERSSLTNFPNLMPRASQK